MIAIDCLQCRKSTVGKNVGEVTTDFEESDNGIQHILVNCSECSSAMLVERYYMLHYELVGDEAKVTRSFGVPYRLWPNPVPSLSIEVPSVVRSDFEEAHKCLSIGAFNGAALLARRMLESIAKDKGATGENLYKKLEDLKSKGHLDGRLEDWASAVKNGGNAAAHKVGVDTQEDATDLLDLAEAVANYVYTFQIRYERFKTRSPRFVSPPPRAPRPSTAKTKLVAKSAPNV